MGHYWAGQGVHGLELDEDLDLSKESVSAGETGRLEVLKDRGVGEHAEEVLDPFDDAQKSRPSQAKDVDDLCSLHVDEDRVSRWSLPEAVRHMEREEGW